MLSRERGLFKISMLARRRKLERCVQIYCISLVLHPKTVLDVLIKFLIIFAVG